MTVKESFALGVGAAFALAMLLTLSYIIGAGDERAEVFRYGCEAYTKAEKAYGQ